MSLTEPELSQRALKLFEAALDEPEDTRADWVARATAGDEALKAKVESLIAADRRASQMLPTGGLMPDAGPAPPERVGRYKIVRNLGGGGMGETFLAQRDDGLFEHEVAIKFVRPSRMAETARALFDRERRALAKLSHRHIAQLFDGGVAENGAPYLVMEYVRGAPIDEVARGRNAREIATLVIDTCDAVQYAHQNLIVHADLKPANILVNQAGDVKVIDFGVARLLSETESGETLHPFTPGFASPEREAGAAPTPADDVFALGALLRELAGAEAPEELQDIAARASAAEVAARYPSAAALRDDLRAWLETRPLAARAGDRFYVLKKFAQRRRLGVMAGAIAIVATLVALAATTYLYLEADRARQLAEQRFADVRGLSRYLLFEVYDRLERTPRTLEMRRDVAREAQGYLEVLARAPNAPADVRIETVEGLLRVAELQAGRQHSNLGEYDNARASLARAEELAAALPQSPTVVTLRTKVALTHANILMDVDQDLETAGVFLGRASDWIESLPQDVRGALPMALAVERATLANWQGRYADGVTIAQRALALAPAEATRETSTLSLRARDALAEAYYYQEKLGEAEAEYRANARAAVAFAAQNTSDMEALRYSVRARWALATTLLQRNRPREALTELNAAAERAPELLAFEPADDATRRMDRIVLAARAQALAMSGNLGEGVRLLRAQVETREALYRQSPQVGDYARSYAITLAMLADLYADHSRAREACPLYAEARGVFSDLETRGLLSEQDRSSAVRMISERQTTHCGQ